MKNCKRELRASEAEKIRRILEEYYESLLTDIMLAQDDIRDDPSDYYSKQPVIDACQEKVDKIDAVIELVGGFSNDPRKNAHLRAFGY